jgi:hypothetical protein
VIIGCCDIFGGRISVKAYLGIQGVQFLVEHVGMQMNLGSEVDKQTLNRINLFETLLNAEKAIAAHHDVKGDDIIPYAIKENVWQGIEDLFMRSPSTRKLVEDGKAIVVGAIYDVGTGKVEWLEESKTGAILAMVNGNPARGMNAMAGAGHDAPTADSHAAPVAAASHGAPVAAAGHGGGVSHAKVEVHAQHVTLIDPAKLSDLDAARHATFNVPSVNLDVVTSSIVWKIAILLGAFAVFGFIAWQSGIFNRMGIAGKLYASFAVVVFIAVLTGVGGFYFLGQVNTKVEMQAAAVDMDMMTDEIATKVNEFLLYGLEDEARGEECVATVNELIEEFKNRRREYQIIWP